MSIILHVGAGTAATAATMLHYPDAITMASKSATVVTVTTPAPAATGPGPGLGLGFVRPLLPLDGGQEFKNQGSDASDAKLPSADIIKIPTIAPIKAPMPSYANCFGLPYQDHNYGAPPPPSPPQSPAKINGSLDEDTTTSVVTNGSANEEEAMKVTATAETSVTRCICEFDHDDEYMICCDKCSVWQHVDCMGLDRNNMPETYMCERCQPRKVDKQKAKALQAKKRQEMTDSSSEDSGDENSQANGNGKAGNTHPTSPTAAASNKGKKARRRKRERSESDKAGTGAGTPPATGANQTPTKKLKKRSRDRPVGSHRRSQQRKRKRSKSTEVNHIDEDARDSWDTSLRDWRDKYEEAESNQYSPEVHLQLSTLKTNGQHEDFARKLALSSSEVQRCRVVEVTKFAKGLLATEDMTQSQIICEYRGKVALVSQFKQQNPVFNNRLHPFVLFYSFAKEQVELCIDSREYGNDARFVRRSCCPNSEVFHMVGSNGGSLHFYLISSQDIKQDEEITIPFDLRFEDWHGIDKLECACMKPTCPIGLHHKKNGLSDSTGQSDNKTTRKVRRVTLVEEDSCLTSESVPATGGSGNSNNNNCKVSPHRTPSSNNEDESTQGAQSRDETTETSSQDGDLMNSGAESGCLSIGANNSLAAGVLGSLADDFETAEEAMERRKKMTREERKMEAIMKAFARMEKTQQRRQETLARMAQRRREEQGKKKENGDQSPVESAAGADLTTPAMEDSGLIHNNDAAVGSSDEGNSNKPMVQSNRTPRKGKKRKNSGTPVRRRSPVNSGGSDVLSPDDGTLSSTSTPTPTTPHCYAFPQQSPVAVTTASSVGGGGRGGGGGSNCEVATPSPSSTPSGNNGFKFPKTKKLLLINNNQPQMVKLEAPLQSSGCSSPSPADNFATSITTTTTTTMTNAASPTCYMRPATGINSAHLRRSSGGSRASIGFGIGTSGELSCATAATLGAGSQGGGSRNPPQHDVILGSAKKRWLRQAMCEEVDADRSSPLPNGSMSPMHGSNSPSTSPPVAADLVTPLKKRRLARESMSSETGFANSPPSTPSHSTSMPSTAMESAQVTDAGSASARLDCIEAPPPPSNSLPAVALGDGSLLAEADDDDINQQQLNALMLQHISASLNKSSHLNGLRAVFRPKDNMYEDFFKKDTPSTSPPVSAAATALSAKMLQLSEVHPQPLTGICEVARIKEEVRCVVEVKPPAPTVADCLVSKIAFASEKVCSDMKDPRACIPITAVEIKTEQPSAASTIPVVEMHCKSTGKVEADIGSPAALGNVKIYPKQEQQDEGDLVFAAVAALLGQDQEVSNSSESSVSTSGFNALASGADGQKRTALLCNLPILTGDDNKKSIGGGHESLSSSSCLESPPAPPPLPPPKKAMDQSMSSPGSDLPNIPKNLENIVDSVAELDLASRRICMSYGLEAEASLVSVTTSSTSVTETAIEPDGRSSAGCENNGSSNGSKVVSESALCTSVAVADSSTGGNRDVSSADSASSSLSCKPLKVATEAASSSKEAKCEEILETEPPAIGASVSTVRVMEYQATPSEMHSIGASSSRVPAKPDSSSSSSNDFELKLLATVAEALNSTINPSELPDNKNSSLPTITPMASPNQSCELSTSLSPTTSNQTAISSSSMGGGSGANPVSAVEERVSLEADTSSNSSSSAPAITSTVSLGALGESYGMCSTGASVMESNSIVTNLVSSMTGSVAVKVVTTSHQQTAKRKVSLLEYRKRKMETQTCTSPRRNSSSPSQASSSPAASASTVSSTTAATTPSNAVLFHQHSGSNSGSDSSSGGSKGLMSSVVADIDLSLLLPKLNTLPLFDDSSQCAMADSSKDASKGMKKDGNKKRAEEEATKWNSAPTTVEQQRENLTERLRREFGLLTDEEAEADKERSAGASATIRSIPTVIGVTGYQRPHPYAYQHYHGIVTQPYPAGAAPVSQKQAPPPPPPPQYPSSSAQVNPYGSHQVAHTPVSHHAAAAAQMRSHHPANNPPPPPPPPPVTVTVAPSAPHTQGQQLLRPSRPALLPTPYQEAHHHYAAAPPPPPPPPAPVAGVSTAKQYAPPQPSTMPPQTSVPHSQPYYSQGYYQ